MRFSRTSLFLALALAACGSINMDAKDPDGGAHGDGDGDGDGSGDGDGDGTGNGDGSGTGNGDGDGTGNGDGDGSIGGGNPEVCDGVDNDLDGIADNIDVQGDGVCDCLNIATIGQIGPWSTGGNVFKDWLNSRGPVAAVELGDQVLTDALLAPYQVIVMLYVGNMEVSNGDRKLTVHHEFTADEAAALDRWVRKGGGLMATIGYGDENTEVVNANRLLSPVGMGYSTVDKETNGFIEDWVAHPVTENILKIKTDNGVAPDATQGVTLARDVNEHVALQVNEVEAGHVIVWGDEWITYDSEWTDTADQQVDRLWLNMLKWMSPPKVCQVELPPLL